jgi:hypothetical protein
MLASAFFALFAVLCCFLSLVFGAVAGDRLIKEDKQGSAFAIFVFAILQICMAFAIVGAL